MPLSHIVIRAGGASPCRHVESDAQLVGQVAALHDVCRGKAISAVLEAARSHKGQQATSQRHRSRPHLQPRPQQPLHSVKQKAHVLHRVNLRQDRRHSLELGSAATGQQHKLPKVAPVCAAKAPACSHRARSFCCCSRRPCAISKLPASKTVSCRVPSPTATSSSHFVLYCSHLWHHQGIRQGRARQHRLQILLAVPALHGVDAHRTLAAPKAQLGQRLLVWL